MPWPERLGVAGRLVDEVRPAVGQLADGRHGVPLAHVDDLVGPHLARERQAVVAGPDDHHPGPQDALDHLGREQPHLPRPEDGHPGPRGDRDHLEARGSRRPAGPRARPPRRRGRAAARGCSAPGTATNSVMPPSTVTPSSSSFSQRLTRPTLQWRQMPQPMQISTATGAPSRHLGHALADGDDLSRDLVADDEPAAAGRVHLVVDPLVAAADPGRAHADEHLPRAHGGDRHVLEDDAALGRILDDGEHARSP